MGWFDWPMYMVLACVWYVCCSGTVGLHNFEVKSGLMREGGGGEAKSGYFCKDPHDIEYVTLELQTNVFMVRAASTMLSLQLFHNSDKVGQPTTKHDLAKRVAIYFAKQIRIPEDRNMVSKADLVRWDLRYGLPFKESSFDLAVSISFLQWLFYGQCQEQLDAFFFSLRSVVRSGGKAVIQFYPASASQVENAVKIAMKHFYGVLVGDYPHLDRGRKLFFILF
ncbi:hypothetical protein Btru_044811 [Bulinus truncatus]|nr:hypothetical protein Btru_044811 [Bulinus truncatus]